MNFGQANNESRETLESFLKDALSADNVKRESATVNIEKLFESNPKANFQLLHFITDKKFVQISTLAAIILKNNILKHNEMFSDQDIDEIFQFLISMANDMPANAKFFYPALISAICSRKGQEFAFKVIFHLKDNFITCEDDLIKIVGIMTIRDLITGPNKFAMNDSILESCLPPVLNFAKHSNPQLKSNCLKIILGLATDRNLFIKKHASQIINEILAHRDLTNFESTNLMLHINLFIYNYAYEEIANDLPNSLSFSFDALVKTNNTATVLIATDFFRNMLVVGLGLEHLQHLFPQLIATLAKNSIFAPIDIDIIEDHSEEDWNIPDSSHILQTLNSNSDYDQIFTAWTIRKSSAMTIDLLSVHFGSTLLPYLFPIIEEFLKKDHWSYLECGNLLLGAISKGCPDDIIRHLNSLIPLIINSCSSQRSIIRSTSVWALSRFSDFIIDDMNFKDSYIDLLCQMLNDKNKSVINASIHALINLQDKLQFEGLPYIDSISESILANVDRFQSNSISALCLFIEIITETVEEYMTDSKKLFCIIKNLSCRFFNLNELTLEFRALANMFSRLIKRKIFKEINSKAMDHVQKCLFILDHDLNILSSLNKIGPIFDEKKFDAKYVENLISYGLLELYVSLIELIDETLNASEISMFADIYQVLLCLCSILFTSNNTLLMIPAFSIAANIILNFHAMNLSDISNEEAIQFIFKKGIMLSFQHMNSNLNSTNDLCSKMIDRFGCFIGERLMIEYVKICKDMLIFDLGHEIKLSFIFSLISIIKFNKHLLLKDKDNKFLLPMLEVVSQSLKFDENEINEDYKNLLADFVIEYNCFDEATMQVFIDFCCLIKGYSANVGLKLSNLINSLPQGFIPEKKKNHLLNIIS